MKIQAGPIPQSESINFGKKYLSAQLPEILRIQNKVKTNKIAKTKNRAGKRSKGVNKVILFALAFCSLFAGLSIWNEYNSPKARLNRLLREVEEMIKENSVDTLNNNQPTDTISIDEFM